MGWLYVKVAGGMRRRLMVILVLRVIWRGLRVGVGCRLLLVVWLHLIRKGSVVVPVLMRLGHVLGII